MNNKKRNNKGFSLVELIVVVAIMAVLVGVLAPAYLKYVESSREKKDANNLEEIRHAVEIAIADEVINDEVKDGTSKVTVAKKDGTIAVSDANDTELLKEVKSVVGDKVELVSKKYSADDNSTYEISITFDADGVVTVKGNWPS